MSAGFHAPRRFTIPVSGSLRLDFSTAASTLASFEITKLRGTTDLTYSLFTTNFTADDLQGAQGRLTGSDWTSYWYPEPLGQNMVAFTGSLTDPPASVVVHMDEIATKSMLVQLSSSAGGDIIFYSHIKTG